MKEGLMDEVISGAQRMEDEGGADDEGARAVGSRLCIFMTSHTAAKASCAA